MDVVSGNTLLPGDPRLIDHIVCELKSQGIFDQFRKECIADVDTKPAYQNLRQRVEGSVTGFLKTQTWRSDMNKNQLREALRKNIYESGFLETGVERIVDQVVNPKINTVFLPQVEDVVYKFLGLEKPMRNNKCNGPLSINTDLLPTDLDPISPDSEVLDKTLNKSDKSNELNLDESKLEDFESPPFEPITEQNTVVQMDESSNDSKISGISGLTSHDSNMSEKDAKHNTIDIHNPDSQLSKVSSNSRLSIITTDSKHTPEKMDISDDTQSSSNKEENNINLFNFDKIGDNINIQQEIKDELEAIRLEINGDSTNKTKDNDDVIKETPEKPEKVDEPIEQPPVEPKDDKPDITNEPPAETKDDVDLTKPDETSDLQPKTDKKPETKDKDRHRHDSERRKDKDKKSDKDKDKKSSSKSSSSSKDKDRHRDKSKENRSKDRERDKKDKKDEKSKSSSSTKHTSRERSKSDSKSDSKSSSSSKKDKKPEKSSFSSSKPKDEKEKSSSSRSRDHSRSDSSSKSTRDRKSSSRDHRDKKDSKDPKKNSKRDKDDHSSSREKKDTRRSADRDSNDGSSGVGNNASSNKENSSSNSNKSKSDSSDTTPGSNSDNSGNSDNSQPCQPDDQTSLNIQKSPKFINLEEKTESQVIITNTNIEVKIKKPKIASNIFEARKLMKIRKKLEKLEKKRQKKYEAVQNQIANIPIDVDYNEDTDSMDSGKLHIHEEEEIKIEEDKNTSVSKASWDEIEAKLNQTVNFDYIDNNDSSSSLTDDKKRSSEDEDVLYFNDQVSPTTERFLKSVETYQKNISSEPKMAPPELEVPTKKIKKTPAKRKQTKGKKRKIEEDTTIIDNNNKKNNHTINIVELAEEFDDKNPSPSASNASNGSIDNKKTKKKKKNSISETYPLPLSPESDISANMENTAPIRYSRASTLKTQRYSSDDLYKPRPFVSGTSRRQRGLLNSTDTK